MTTNPTDQTTTPAAPQSWMSTATVNNLHARYAELIKSAEEFDELIAEARKEVFDAEQQLEIRKTLAANTRTEINEIQILLAMAEGRAPRPDIDAVHSDGMNLRFGALRVAGLPDNPIRDDYLAHGALMRQIMNAALDIADRADKDAATAPSRRWTPDAVNPDGSKKIRQKRACNGCGDLLGDVTEAEINAAVEGRQLPDVRSECPRCNAPAEQPATATGAEPLTPKPQQPAAEPLPTETLTDLPTAAPTGESR